MYKLMTVTILTALLTACASGSSGPRVSFMRYTESVYPASQAVEVLRSKPVNREYVELGELSITSQENSVVFLKKKAQLLGADAIVILGEYSTGGAAFPIGRFVMYDEDKKLVAIAIKYK